MLNRRGPGDDDEENLDESGRESQRAWRGRGGRVHAVAGLSDFRADNPDDQSRKDDGALAAAVLRADPDRFTIDDSKAYTKPFTVRVNHRLMPDTEMMEFVCEERDAIHYVGGKGK